MSQIYLFKAICEYKILAKISKFTTMCNFMLEYNSSHISKELLDTIGSKAYCPHINHVLTQVNRMSRSRRVLAIGGKHCDYGWTGSVFIHFYFL